jgi:hypothetical protein
MTQIGVKSQTEDATMELWQQNTFHRVFDGTGDFADYLTTESAKPEHAKDTQRAKTQYGDAWSGGSYGDALNMASVGAKPALVDKVEREINKVEQAILLTDAQTRLGSDLVGFMPHVPNYLLGVPDAMLAPCYNEASSRGVLKIAVNVTVSASISDEQIRQRGVAVAALAYLMASVRPVELVAFATLGTTKALPGLDGDYRTYAAVPEIILGSSPLNIPLCTFALCEPSFLRRLCFAFREIHIPANDHGPWAWHLDPNSATMQSRLREVMGLTSEDLLINGTISADGKMRDPTVWVREQIKLHAPEFLAE